MTRGDARSSEVDNCRSSHRVAASTRYGCSLHHVGCKPRSRRVAASITQGCSVDHMGLQPPHLAEVEVFLVPLPRALLLERISLAVVQAMVSAW